MLAKDPTRVEAHHFLAISYDRQYERVFALDDDYVEALRYQDTLLRMRAQLTVDAGAAAQMVAEADLARDRAAALQ